MKKSLIIILLSVFITNLYAENSRLEAALLEIAKMKDDSIKVKKYLSTIELITEESPLRVVFAENGLKTAQRIKWKEGIGLCNYYIAWYYLFENNRLLATEYFLKASEYANDLSIKVNSYGMISTLYSWEKRHDMALDYALKGWGLVADTEIHPKVKTEALIYLGDVYHSSKDKKEGRYCYMRAFDIAHNKHLHDPDYTILRMITYVHLIDAPIDDPASVLNYSRTIKNLYDKSTVIEKYKTVIYIIKIATAYIISVGNEKVKELELNAKEKQKKIYIGGMIILLLLLALLIWQNYTRKKAIQELAKANEMKSRFFGILNHDLRQPVAGLITYLQFKTEAPDAINKEDIAAFDKKTMNMAKNLLENMEDLLLWCKDQMQNFTPYFQSVKVSKLFEDTKAFFNYEESIVIHFENPQDLKITTDQDYVKTIMRNLTANAIAATVNQKERLIIWKCYQTKANIILSIHNNGDKMSQDKIDVVLNKNKERNTKEGLGLAIVKRLAESIDCKIEVKSNEMDGTVFNLIFK